VCCVRSALWLSWPACVFVRTWTTACCTFTRVDCASVCSVSMHPHKRGKQVRKVRQFSCGVCTAPRMRASMLLAVDCCLKDSTHTRGCNTTRRCVPSRNEPFGIVVLEAWASGKVLSTCVHVCAHGMRTCAQVMLLYPWCVCVCANKCRLKRRRVCVCAERECTCMCMHVSFCLCRSVCAVVHLCVHAQGPCVGGDVTCMPSPCVCLSACVLISRW